jgi:hypothetical protein
VRNVTLEMSLKPFRTLDPGDHAAVCRRAFAQWAPLIARADGVSVLLWTADGSEILEYRGDLDTPLEWARYIGHANPREKVKGDPDGRALHSRPYLYMDHPPAHTYRSLAAIVATLKTVGREVTGKPVRVGATFDPGGEFARSAFKYERHNEICLAGTMGQGSFVCCYGVLKGDREPYAGFPQGIPDGTPLGTFLGRQSRHFLGDLGFDYLWLSNGFGFGLETWKTTGPLFDGREFQPARATEVRRLILDFWRRFRAECPAFALETRGTNLLAGSDLATNGTPLLDLYRGGFDVAPPPNSPWAALNGDFGLELVGYLSRIAELPPGKGYPFRYYIHDPWWLNSPWLDRYGREPHDIYLPLAVSRLDAAGRVVRPDSLALLTIDDSYGQMPDKVPLEVIPHLHAALDDAPDQPGPLVWVYPLAEYQEAVFGPAPRPAEPFAGDWLLRAAVNNGLALNTVVSSGHFLGMAPTLLADCVLLSPVPDGDGPLAAHLLAHVAQGGRALLYGPLGRAGAELLGALGLRCAAPLTGELTIAVDGSLDQLTERPYPTRLNHRPAMCAGGIEAVLSADAATAHVLASVEQGGERRVAALWRGLSAWRGGRLAWVRGTQSASYRGGHLLTPDDPAQWFPGEVLLRQALATLGVTVAVSKRTPGQRNPVLAIARCRGGLQFSGYTPNTTVELRLRLPQGAPILTGGEATLSDGLACYRLPRAWHRECRVCVEQARGEVSCVEQHSGEIGIRRRLALTGLENAVVRFWPEPDRADRTAFLAKPAFPYLTGDFRQPVREGECLRVGPVSGALLISW